jgi:integrase
MKSGRGHRVPLSRAAISVLKEMQGRHQDDLVFPGDRRGKPLSNMAVLMVLRRMDRAELTGHGFGFDVPRLGPPSAPIFQARSPRRRWRMWLATK